jgi:hypothetical protein
MRTATRPETRRITLDRNPSGAGNGLHAAIAKAAALVRKADAPTAAGWQREQGPVRTLQRLARRTKRPAVIASGAGTDIPSVRRLCESLHAPLIRINPRAPRLASGCSTGIAASTLDGSQCLRHALAI